MITVLTVSDFTWQDEQVETGVSTGAVKLDRDARRDESLLTAPTCIEYALDEHAPHSRSYIRYALPKSGAVSSLGHEKDADPALPPTVTTRTITYKMPASPVHDQVDADVPPEYWSRMRALLARAPIVADDVDTDDEPVL